MTTRLIAAVVLVAGIWFGANTYTQRQQAAAAAQKAAAKRATYEADALKAIAAIRGAVVAIDAVVVAKDTIPPELPEIATVSMAIDPIRGVTCPSRDCIALAQSSLWDMWEVKQTGLVARVDIARMKVNANLAIAEEAIKVGK